MVEKGQEVIKNACQAKDSFAEVTLSEIISISDNIQRICTELSNAAKDVLKREYQRIEYLASLEFEQSEENDEVPHDPGKRPKPLSEKQKNYLSTIGPFQPKLSLFPKNPNISNEKQCQFSASWYNSYPYLEYSVENDAAYCFVCNMFPSGIDRAKGEDAWINGIRAWSKMKGSQGKKKPGKLTQHFTSMAHQASVCDYINFIDENRHINKLLDQSNKQQLIEEGRLFNRNKEVIEILLDVTRTLARQGLALRGHDENNSNFNQIVALLARHNPILKRWLNEKCFRKYQTTYTSPSSQNEFLELLAGSAKKKIVHEVNQSGTYGVVADTTPDVAHLDQLTVAVRYVDSEGDPKERLIQTREVHVKTGAGLAKEIISTLSESNVELDNLRFQTSDSASSMSGKYKGAQKIVSEILERKITYIPCLPHGVNLVIEHSSKASPVVWKMYDTLERAYVFFSSSTKRHDTLSQK